MKELLGQQHFHVKAQEPLTEYSYHDLGLEAENTFGEDQTPEIDLVNEPQEWILGFDAGFNNRPLVSGNTRQYCEGYLQGQQAWKDTAASPSVSSAASESSNLASLDGDTIDPHLLDFDAYADDDLFKTPTQLTTATRSDGSNSNRECNNIFSLSLGSTPQSNVQTPRSLAPSSSRAGIHEAHHRAENVLDMDTRNIYLPFSTSATDTHESLTPAPSWTPINARRVSCVRSAPATRVPIAHTPSPPLVTYDAHVNIDHTSPCVRRSLSMAKHARVEAELLQSQGNLDAAAAAVVDAAHWEKKARRLQSKNESQRKIRAQKRAGRSAMGT